MFFAKNTAGQKFALTMVETDGTLYVPALAADVTVRRSIDGGAWAAGTGTLTITAGELLYEMSAADCNGNTIAFIFTATGVVPEDRTIQTYPVLQAAILDAIIGVEVITPITGATAKVRHALAAAFLSLFGEETPDDLNDPDPVIDLTWPGDATVVYQYDAHTALGDWLTDRGFTRYRAMLPTFRDVTAVATPTVDDCHAAAFVLAAGDESLVGVDFLRKRPNGSTFVALELDDADDPTARTRNP